MQIYRASASRTTPSEAKYNEVSGAVIALVNSLKEPEDAETLWLAFLEQGHKLSISTFYGHLRKLAEAGSIQKIPAFHHRALYFKLEDRSKHAPNGH